MTSFVVILFKVLLSVSFADSELIFVVVDGLSGSLLAKYKDIYGFNRFVENGVWSDNLVPAFPPLTMPNLYSLVTGHYPQEHGIVSDFFVDTGTNRKFYGGVEGTDYESYFVKSEPIWTTLINQTPQIREPVVFPTWPGCYSIRADAPGASKPYCVNRYLMGEKEDSITLKDCTGQLCSYASPNSNYKFYGFFDSGIALDVSDLGIDHVFLERDLVMKSDRIKPVLDTERVLSVLIDTVDANNQLNEQKGQPRSWNLVVAGTHGFVDIREKNRRYLDDNILLRKITRTVNDGAFMMVEPDKGKEQEVFDRLRELLSGRNVSVYWTDPKTEFEGEKVPERLRYTKSSRILSILLLAQKGFGIFSRSGHHFPRESDVPRHVLSSERVALGGYDNEQPEMAAAFLAYGPAFKRGHYLPEVHTVDVYPLLCSLLNITCPQRSGQLDRIYGVTINGTTTRRAYALLLACFMLLSAVK